MQGRRASPIRSSATRVPARARQQRSHPHSALWLQALHTRLPLATRLLRPRQRRRRLSASAKPTRRTRIPQQTVRRVHRLVHHTQARRQRPWRLLASAKPTRRTLTPQQTVRRVHRLAHLTQRTEPRVQHRRPPTRRPPRFVPPPARPPPLRPPTPTRPPPQHRPHHPPPRTIPPRPRCRPARRRPRIRTAPPVRLRWSVRPRQAHQGLWTAAGTVEEGPLAARTSVW
jgi:hypothetical protein